MALESRADDAIDICIQEGAFGFTGLLLCFASLRRMATIECVMCGDYTSTVNQAIKSETDLLFSNHAGCTVFSQFDLNHAYQQLAVQDINEHYSRTVLSH